MSAHTPVSKTRIRTRRILAIAVVSAAIAITALVAIPLVGALSPATRVEASEAGAAGKPGAAGSEAEHSGVTAFDDDPAVTRMNPDLLRALQRATTDAAREDVTVEVTSGWRSPEYQDRLLEDAVAKYGSREEAARWVASSKTSAHVSGDAVDVGGFEAMLWLKTNGAAYGLCRIYDNEPWHFELRPEAPTRGCPDVYWDPTYDPRMRG
jgi:uncharacterized protein YcbK (DUF882 family)